MPLSTKRLQGKSCVWCLVIFAYMAGCPSGVDFTALPLDEAQVIDYGQAVIEGRLPKEAVVYGQLLPGDGFGMGRKAFEAEQKDLYGDVKKLRLLTTPKNRSAQERKFLDFADELESKIDEMALAIHHAQMSAEGAKNLAMVLMPELREDGHIAVMLRNAEKPVPPSIKASFLAIASHVLRSFENLYKTAIVMAQSFIQQEAQTHVAAIKNALHGFVSVGRNKALFQTVADYEKASLVLVDANLKLNNVRDYIFMFTNRSKVASAFSSYVQQLNNAIKELDQHYLKLMTKSEQPAAKAFYDDALRGVEALVKLAADYGGGNGIEQLKEQKSDAALDRLLEMAFISTTPFLGGLRLEQATDANNLMSMLARAVIVRMPNNALSQYMVYALAAGVTSNVSEQFDLRVSSVRGLDSSLLLQAKNNFVMTNGQFNEYVISRAERLREERLKAGRSDVYVLFFDSLVREGVDVSRVIEAYARGGGKVLVVTSEQNELSQKGEMFMPQSLRMAEGLLVTQAVLLEDPSLSGNDAFGIADKLMRMTIGQGIPLKLNEVALFAKDAARPLRGQNNSDSTIEEAVKNTLFSHNIATSSVEFSGVLSAPLSVLEDNLKKDPQHYAKPALAFDMHGRTHETSLIRTAGERAKSLESTMMVAEARLVDKNQLKHVYDRYKAALDGVLGGLNLSERVSAYKGDIDDAKRDALGTLSSMKTLLSSDLCEFKSEDVKTGNAADYEGGYKNFFNAVAIQPFSQPHVKNPLAQFTLTSRSIIAPNPKDGPVRAAIGLNCFLAGHKRGDHHDVQAVLKMKIKNIEKHIIELTEDAIHLVNGFRSTNNAELLAHWQTLKDRMLEATAGDVPVYNDRYWKKHLSRLQPSSVGMAVPEGVIKPLYYGADFDVKSFVHRYPNNYGKIANTELFPTLYGNFSELPEYFFASRELFAKSNEGQRGYSGFLERASSMDKRAWSITRVYGHALAQGNGAMGIGSIAHLDLVMALSHHGDHPPALLWYPRINEFDCMNSRIWAWFLSRIVGVITNEIPLPEELYQAQDGKNYFANNEVFIERVFMLTKQFLQTANRVIIAQMALLVLDDYHAIMEELYSLPPDDYNAFLRQAPPTELARFFNRIMTVMDEELNVSALRNGDYASVMAWELEFFHYDIISLLPEGLHPQGFQRAVPGNLGDDGRLLPIWSSLVKKAVRIEGLRKQIYQRIFLVDP